MKNSEYGDEADHRMAGEAVLAHDLLAFSSIDENAVETLFKIYLDTKLVGFTQAPVYRTKVNDFRAHVLDPYTAPKEPELGVDERVARKDAFARHRAQFEQARAFLYWFDLRADYWADNPPTPKLLTVIVPAVDLITHQREAELFRERLTAAAGSRTSERDKRRLILLDIIANDPDVAVAAAAVVKTADAAKAAAQLAADGAAHGTPQAQLAKAKLRVATEAHRLAQASEAKIAAETKWLKATNDLQALLPKP